MCITGAIHISVVIEDNIMTVTMLDGHCLSPFKYGHPSAVIMIDNGGNWSIVSVVSLTECEYHQYDRADD